MELWKKACALVVLALLPVVVILVWLKAPAASVAIVLAVGALVIGLMRRLLLPLGEITRAVEGIAVGRLRADDLEIAGNDELGRLAEAAQQISGQMVGLQKHADVLMSGSFGVAAVEQRVVRSGKLSDADVAVPRDAGELERSLVQVTNRMRRLAIQARLVARGELKSPLLKERIGGDLGESFGLVVEEAHTIAERARQIAAGDLSVQVEGGGELNASFQAMVQGLRELVEQIIETALHISSSSEEILFVLRDQELAASHQASGVEETQRTMETLLSSARKIAESTQTVFRSAEKTQANHRVVGDRIGELKAHTGRISEILEVIKAIADRSDLLALNASLEGMRAGEAGKGFTLVASEMRRLAENVKASVGDIKELVSDIRESSLATVVATEDGSRLSEKTTETALKISLITQQQQSGTEQVTQSMDELSHLINQGVAGTRQVTLAASELTRLSQELGQLVQRFRLPVDVEGKKSGGMSGAAKNLAKGRGLTEHSMQALLGLGAASGSGVARSELSMDSLSAAGGARSDLSAEFMAIGAVPVALETGKTRGRVESGGNSSISAMPARKMHETPIGLPHDRQEGPPTVEFSASLDAEMLQDLGTRRLSRSAPKREDAFDAIARRLEEDDSQVGSSEPE